MALIKDAAMVAEVRMRIADALGLQGSLQHMIEGISSMSQGTDK